VGTRRYLRILKKYVDIRITNTHTDMKQIWGGYLSSR